MAEEGSTISIICLLYTSICTPYLIIDNEMMTALCLAAKSGVDVRIMTPGIPDKKLVFILTPVSYTHLGQDQCLCGSKGSHGSVQ